MLNPPNGSACEGGNGYTCYDHAPYAVCEDLAYGYAAVPAHSPQCGKCFVLEFDGGNKDGIVKASHRSIKGKKMIVMASNVGGDVADGQVDILIPGGGVGQFNGCSNQWGTNDLGKQYGGFLSTCQDEQNNWDDINALKDCVRKKCNSVFSGSGLKQLRDGCIWFVDWMNVADNPTFTRKEVPCPPELKQAYR